MVVFVCRCKLPYSICIFLKHLLFFLVPPRSISKTLLCVIGFLSVGTMGLSNASVGYLNYPTQVIFKCCKMIPVMIGGVLVQREFFHHHHRQHHHFIVIQRNDTPVVRYWQCSSWQLAWSDSPWSTSLSIRRSRSGVSSIRCTVMSLLFLSVLVLLLCCVCVGFSWLGYLFFDHIGHNNWGSVLTKLTGIVNCSVQRTTLSDARIIKFWNEFNRFDMVGNEPHSSIDCSDPHYKPYANACVLLHRSIPHLNSSWNDGP